MLKCERSQGRSLAQGLYQDTDHSQTTFLWQQEQRPGCSSELKHFCMCEGGGSVQRN